MLTGSAARLRKTCRKAYITSLTHPQHPKTKVIQNDFLASLKANEMRMSEFHR